MDNVKKRELHIHKNKGLFSFSLVYLLSTIRMPSSGRDALFSLELEGTLILLRLFEQSGVIYEHIHIYLTHPPLRRERPLHVHCALPTLYIILCVQYMFT